MTTPRVEETSIDSIGVPELVRYVNRLAGKLDELEDVVAKASVQPVQSSVSVASGSTSEPVQQPPIIVGGA